MNKPFLRSAAVILGGAALTYSLFNVFSFNVHHTSVFAAEGSISYDLNKLPVYSSRTPESIEEMYVKCTNDSTYYDGDPESYYDIEASVSPPYSQGLISNDTACAMQGMTDFYRYLSGVHTLSSESTPQPYLQYQAFDRNFYFEHKIPADGRPAGMDKTFWEQGVECRHNVLAGGCTPRGSVTAFVNEGFDLVSGEWTTLGHRYALISPEVSQVQFGYCGDIAVGHITERLNCSSYSGYYAFPSPGYVPSEVVDPLRCEWTVDIENDELSLKSISDLEVTVTNLDDGGEYTCTMKNCMIDPEFTNGKRVGFVQPFDYSIIDGKEQYDDDYRVCITGFKDKSTNAPVSIEYTVSFFNMK